MADAVASQILMDGPRHAVMKFTNTSDGTGEAAVQKVDASALEVGPDGRPCASVVIDKVQYMTKGMSVRVLWDATTDVLAFETPIEGDGKQCFAGIGGLQNDSGAGKTGDVNFTTVGHTAGDMYTIVLHMRKRY
ncbi:MAG: hypothetical protein B7Z37_23280 [Verrucomicrobia bacterium 12-59-8]|nr:MAG: hypothetical protein B7Z37_23280 [Verrucomicrobia bacterium 12-59-8]